MCKRNKMEKFLGFVFLCPLSSLKVSIGQLTEEPGRHGAGQGKDEERCREKQDWHSPSLLFLWLFLSFQSVWVRIQSEKQKHVRAHAHTHVCFRYCLGYDNRVSETG